MHSNLNLNCGEFIAQRAKGFSGAPADAHQRAKSSLVAGP
jgi:hypothetical protein